MRTVTFYQKTFIKIEEGNVLTEGQKVLELAGYAGSILLKSGAEIFRVQETMSHIIESFGITNYNVYVLSNGIFASVGEGTPEHYSLVRNVPLGEANLSRVDGVNSVSRQLQAGAYDADTAFEKLKEIENWNPQSKRVQIFSCGYASMAFCYLFGGSLLDCLCVFFIGLLLELYQLSPYKTRSGFTSMIFSSGMVTLCSALCSLILPILNFDHLVIGSIFALFPGLLFTNSIREFFNGDYLSGMIHMIHAILIAVCVALGVCGIILLFRLFGGISL